MSKVPQGDYKIQVTTQGDNPTSEELAEKINSLGLRGQSNISFIVGSSEKFEADEYIAISPMDMDLGLLTTIVYEQIYRAYRIINNHSYHK